MGRWLAEAAPPGEGALRSHQLFPALSGRGAARSAGAGARMEYFMVPAQKVPALQHFRKSEKEVIGGLCSLANIPLTPETQRDQERRIRREIANSNERRRMQSINAGFQSLKTLIPHTDGEKLSKAAILQQTAEYIFSLEQEKTRLLQQNTQLKRFIQEFSGSSPKRRRAEDKDEGIGSPDIWEDEKAEDLRREMIELRQQLDKERSVRMMLEEQVRSLEAHMYPEKLKVIAQQVQLQQQQEQVRLLHQEKLEREQQIRTQALQGRSSPGESPNSSCTCSSRAHLGRPFSVHLVIRLHLPDRDAGHRTMQQMTEMCCTCSVTCHNELSTMV
ncbi:transcription factor AP-4 isoform X4 [Emydura macquarii macquarii]|uniref:transcription factor AP-4 isoform X4 n=1 Tax=Emydura macquarii macquarii TaxID=1129001 RepID=UPI00352B91D9